MSEEHDLETSIIEYTSSLKGQLVQGYFKDIAFFPSGKYLLVYPTLVHVHILLRHCMAVITSTDLTKAFERTVRRKLQEKQKGDIYYLATDSRRMSFQNRWI